MTTVLDVHRITRKNILNAIEGLSLEQINKIPAGFTGNLAWHLGHVVATRQGLLYRLSGLEQNLDPVFVEKYKKGSVPMAPVDQSELDYIKEQLLQQPENLDRDLQRGIFKSYAEYTTSYGNTIHSFDEAIAFVNVHEGLHLGYIMALKRTVLAG